MRVLKLKIAVALLTFCLGWGGYFFIKFGLPTSDYQRINALEIRVEALEDKNNG